MKSETGAPATARLEPSGFATTRWSLILSATHSEGDQQVTQQALTELCRSYWRPVFLFVNRQGYSTPEAQDLTQDFFVTILASDWWCQADPERGRFRSFLLKSVQNFLSHAEEQRRTIKRGGQVQFISWDEWLAERPSQFAVPNQIAETLAPDRFFDLRWAATVVEHALQRLREECEGKGRLRLFEILRDYLASERGDITYADLAIALGIAETMVKKQLYNMRQRFRWLLRDEVAQTVGNQMDVDEEIRHLCTVLATTNSPTSDG